jgi:hypothetical protein
MSSSLHQLSPDLLPESSFLWGLADYAVRSQIPVDLQELSHLDNALPSLVSAAFQQMRSLTYEQA